MIGFNSLYLWYENNEYEHLKNETDRNMKRGVNKYDLYTK